MIYTDVNRAGGNKRGFHQRVKANNWEEAGMGACINLRSITINVISADRNDSYDSSSLSKKNWGGGDNSYVKVFRQRYYFVKN